MRPIAAAPRIPAATRAPCAARCAPVRGIPATAVTLDVVAFDRPSTAVYGKLRTTLEKRGQSIGAMDLLIAAHALALNVRLVTHNVREFSRVPGLRVETWE